MLDPGIRAAGVFVDEQPQVIEALVSRGVIDAVQLHGRENEDYIQDLRNSWETPVSSRRFLSARSRMPKERRRAAQT